MATGVAPAIITFSLRAGYVTTYASEQSAAAVAAALCVVSICIVMAFVPASTKHRSKCSESSKDNYS